MKKLLKGLLAGTVVCLLCGCQNIESANIYTTVYPVEYLADTLYGSHASITSIYPNGTDVSSYTLTDKQIETYAKGDIFIYNGTTNEKDLAKNLVNKNKSLKIIDAAYSLNYKNGVEELWLSPSNYLMLATNVKDNLEDQIGTKYLNEEIDKKYKTLEEDLSVMDAEIRNIAKESSTRNENTLIVSSNVFKYLSDYGFNIISLEDYAGNDAGLTTIRNNFKSGKYKYILVKNTETTNDLISEMTKNGASPIVVNMMNTLTEEDRTNNETYFTLMNNYVSDLKTATNY